MNKVIIGAPFGNYFNFPNTTNTLGTFTEASRGGFFTRVRKVLQTVRYNRRQQSWINKLGLPNPGIYGVFKRDYNENRENIISIRGFSKLEWSRLVNNAYMYGAYAIELNISCPNVTKVYLNDLDDIFKL